MRFAGDKTAFSFVGTFLRNSPMSFREGFLKTIFGVKVSGGMTMIFLVGGEVIG